MKAKLRSSVYYLFYYAPFPYFYSCSNEADDFYLFEYWEVMLNPEPPISENQFVNHRRYKVGN